MALSGPAQAFLLVLGNGSGGLWIVEAADKEAAEALVHADPFWPTWLRKSIQILAWKQVFAGGTRLI